jgi:aerobic-type carbon monoxide dehydrogenase small subunit (CoxS/CutS family)
MSDSAKPHLPPPENRPDQQPAGDDAKNGISRRGFLKGAGLTAAGTALLDGVQAFSREPGSTADSGVTELGPGPVPVRLRINGKEHSLEIEPRTTLADALRIHLGMTGTKIICDRGACSGCTVLLDKMPVNSCMTLAVDAIGLDVTTIEGLASESSPHPLQIAFVKHDALQCGFCTPGMVMSAIDLVARYPNADEATIRQHLEGNLCRCTGYHNIVKAVRQGAAAMAK